jgi:VCBS repeat-containing protein
MFSTTVAGNTANFGGGLETGNFAGVSATLQNSIIAINVADIRGPDIDGFITSLGHNLIGNGNNSGPFLQTDILNVDPLLGPLANNGGPTQTRALLAGSPAIDAANTATSPATDQRGVARPQGPAADIGAYELAPINRPPVASDGSLTTNEDTAANGTLVANDPDGDALQYTLVSTTNAHGTVIITNPATGAYTYTPDANYFGPASFTFKASDAALDSNTATVSITVNSVNDPPVTVNDSYSIDEDKILNISTPGVLGNDTDVENNPLTAVLVAGPANGIVTLNANGSFSYRPRFDFNGTDTFTYKARDSAGADGNTATVTITVNPINDAPRPTPPITKVTTNEDTATGGQLKATDPEGDAFTFSSPPEFAPQHGTVVVNADGTWTYTPHANFYTPVDEPDVFGYKVTDVHGAEGIGIVEITIKSVNDAPTAVNDTYSVDEDGTLVVGDGSPISRLRMISEPGDFVGQGLVWDFNPAMAAFTARTNFDNGVEVLVDPPGPVEQWRLNFAAIDSVPLTPGTYLNATRWPFQAPNEPGLDVSGYGRGLNRLKGEFTVYDVGYSPTGGVTRFAATFVQQDHNFDDTLEPPLYGAIVFNSTFGAGRGILTNDTDVEGELFLGAKLVTSPTHGDLAFNEDGSFVYKPFPNFNGTDTFTYRTGDARDDSNVASVTINVGAVNDPPVANNGAGSTDEDTPLNGTVTATDVDGDPLTFSVVAGPANGTLTSFNAATGAFTYAPAANYNGPDSFTFKASDGQADSNVATFTITVDPVNDAPAANDGSGSTDEDTALSGNLSATDVDGDPLTFHRVAGPANGTVVVNTDGTFTYTPAANFNGTDSFTFKANDGAMDSNTATMTITVGAVNDNPVANDDSAATDEDTALTIAVLANDTDVDGDTLIVSAVTQPAHGTVVINANSTVTYTPAGNYHGPDSFTYTASDGNGGTDTAIVSLTVRPVNDAPVAVNDSATTDEDTPVTVDVIANDIDVDGDALKAVLVAGPAHGAVVLNADGTFTYTPAGNYNGPDSFTYKASDGTLTSNTATVSLTVTAVNDAPVATDDSYAVAQDAPLDVPPAGVLANDLDVDGDALSATLVVGPRNGTLTLNADGSFRYVPNAGFTGTDEFTYQASDGSLTSNTATVTLRVAPAGNTEGKVTGAGKLADQRLFTLSVKSKAKKAGGFNITGKVYFLDVRNRVLLHAAKVQSFRVEADGRAVISGTAKVNGRSGYQFTVTVHDRGSPGRGRDSYRIQITGPGGFSYDSLDGVLTAGNIKVHRKP